MKPDAGRYKGVQDWARKRHKTYQAFTRTIIDELEQLKGKP